jgi:hypothetical protein
MGSAGHIAVDCRRDDTNLTLNLDRARLPSGARGPCGFGTWLAGTVGYALSRSIDARLAIAALKAAIRTRQPSLTISNGNVAR